MLPFSTGSNPEGCWHASECVPDEPPRDAPEYGSLVANPRYQDCLRSTCDTTSPATVSEIVGAPPDFNTTESDDPFWTRVRGQQG